jgi:hypothetical protein
MRKLILFAGVAALTAAVPAAAEAQGRGQGRGQAARAEQPMRINTNRGPVRADARTRTRMDAERRAIRSGDRMRIDDRLRVDRNRDGIDDRAQNRYGGAACPPGLANRSPACLPPGQARRMFQQGQALPRSYSDFTPYDTLLGRIPESYRDDIPTGYRYVYRDDSVYVVDPQTRIIRSIIDLIR